LYVISNSKIDQVEFFNFRCFSTLLVTLHDYIFKELLSLPHLASALYDVGIAPVSILFLYPFVSVGTAKVEIFLASPK